MSTIAPAAPQLVAANRFQFTGHQLHITYAPFVEAGEPTFIYQDQSQTLTFHGAEIQSTTTDLGTVVTVFTRRTIDSGSTTFSLLVPRVQVQFKGSVSIITEGISAIHQFSNVPAFNHGQLDHYTVTMLRGTASHVLF